MPDQAAVDMGIAKRAGPALSATSDMPATPPASAESAAPTAAEAPASTQAEPKVDKTADGAEIQDTGGDKPAGDKPPAKADETPPAIKREITIERNKRRAAEEAARLATERLDKALAALEKANPTEDDKRPARETFDDPAAYDRALEDYAGRKAAAKALQDDADKRRTEAQRATAEEAIAAYNVRRAEFAAKHPDYADLVEADDLHFTVPMTQAIVNDEDGPGIAYYLAQHPEEFARITKLGDTQAATAIGRIAAKLQRQPAAVKRDPIAPVGARASATSDASSESMDSYAARRTKELQAGHRPFIAGRQL